MVLWIKVNAIHLQEFVWGLHQAKDIILKKYLHYTANMMMMKMAI